MFNPILENISSVYQWFWIGVLVLFIVDWSFGFDKVSAALNRACELYEEFVPIETIAPILLFTIIGCLTRVLSIPDSSGLFAVLATMFGILTVGYFVLVVLGALLIKALFKLREFSIERRAEKARKKSLTPDE